MMVDYGSLMMNDDCIYNYLGTLKRTVLFLVRYGFTFNGHCFGHCFVQMRIWGLRYCERLFKWHDSPGFQHPPTAKEQLQPGSRLAVMIGAPYTAIFAAQFGCTHKT